MASDAKADNNFIELFAQADIWDMDTIYSKIINEFDVDRDHCLNTFEFEAFLKEIFHKDYYKLTESQKQNLMSLLDGNKDGKICENDFRVGGFHWLEMVMKPVSALVIIDVQNDFIDGSLSLNSCPAGQDGLCVVPVINNLLDNVHFDVVIYSRDWHPQDHISFIGNVENRKMDSSSKVSASSASTFDTVVFEGGAHGITEQKLWPEHCVQGSDGAELHRDLKIAEDSLIINKGINSDIDSYSAFWDNCKLSQTDLVKELLKRRVTDVYCCGIAYDVCVGSTAFHSLEHGFRTILIEDATRGVSLEDIDKTRADLISKGAVIVQSSEVSDMVSGHDRRPELALQAAEDIALARKLADNNIL